ncbi:hypothetical protein ACIBM1_50355 [Streptomyces sp. NPDC050481]|uniref:hypothetical protein n=1 Tax=Streptomyces sp. NPDC050481 TaxID=3365616 RepID=UPI00378B9A06
MPGIGQGIDKAHTAAGLGQWIRFGHTWPVRRPTLVLNLQFSDIIAIVEYQVPDAIRV